MSLPWEEIPHTADWALKVRGATLRSLFENAARGMVSLIGGQAGQGEPAFHREYDLRAPDLEMLLVDWLTELLALVEDEGAVISQVEVSQVAEFALKARIGAQAGGQFSKHIKAVTFHKLEIRHTPEGFETVIVFDV
jgi:SHS2 domain-containing protein